MLLGGVSASAVLLAGDAAEARNLLSNGGISPAAAVIAAQQAAAAQAAAAARQAQESLAQAAAALKAMQATQQAARALASQASSNVPDGIAKLGLMPKGGTPSDPIAGIKADPTLWQGAGPPVQSQKGSQVAVDINQQQQKAILTWETFNVGANTAVNFHQGAANWTVLNRVVDPTLAPSQILGHITADGGVYIINRNGIIFGGGSQVDVHALLASTLDVGKLGTNLLARNQFFLTTGIANPFSFSIFDPNGGAATHIVGGDVTVQQGASITTSIVGLDSPGFVYLFAANVHNSGTITVPAGEVGMVAARAIDLVPGGYSQFPASVVPAGVTFRGTEFQIQNFATDYNPGQGSIPPGTPKSAKYLPGTGVVTHDGLIEAPRGIVVMNGDQVNVEAPGVISADTSIGRNSMVLLRATTSVTLDGTISILPFDDGNTLPMLNGSATQATGSIVQSFTPAYVDLTAQSLVTLGSTGLISAPSANVSLRATDLASNTALAGVYSSNGPSCCFFHLDENILSNQSGPQRVLLEPGATIDVAGLQDVVLPASYNFISFQPRAEFADMPLQRNGPLYGATLWIDIRTSGTRSDGTSWVGTPLADASGVIGQVGQSIQQLMTVGGSVNLATRTTDTTAGVPGRDVILEPGSVINMAGGSVQFLPGMVPTTRLIGADGRIYSMANADPNITYAGIAGQFTDNHAHWGITETWTSLNQTFEPGYVEGHDAGGVTLSTINPVLQGTMLFGAVAGQLQLASGIAPSQTGGVANTQANRGELPSQGYLALTTPSTVVIGPNGAPALPVGFGPETVLPSADPKNLPSDDLPTAGSVPSSNFTSTSAYRTLLSASQLSAYGLSAISIKSDDLVVAAGSTLALAPGGNFSAKTAGAIDIAGTVLAPAGTIALLSNAFNGAVNPDLFVSSVTASGHADILVEGALNVSGRWVNDSGLFGTDALGPAFINGGRISLATNSSSNSAGQDTTGNILLAVGSVLDVSSGGYISPQGKPKTTSSGTLAGDAGSISLAVYQGPFFAPLSSTNPTPPTSGTVAGIELDGAMRAYGFARNGSLTLGAPETIRIGGALQAGDKSAIKVGGSSGPLNASLFTNGGFGNYLIESTPDGYSGAVGSIVVSAGVNLTLEQQNLSSVGDYNSIPTGTKISAVAALATLPEDERVPVNLTLKSSNILLDLGSSIVTDPKAQITLAGVPNFSTTPAIQHRAQSVLLRGSIIDHGGTVSVNAAQTWLGSQSLIDLSGVFVPNSRFGQPGGPSVSGMLPPGGTFSVESANPTDLTAASNPDLSGTYLVSENGATVDISGATATIQVQRSSASHASFSSVASWSDAGMVSVDSGAFLWGGTFVANADPRANRGTLILGGAAINIRQSSDGLRTALSRVAEPTIATGLPPLAKFPALAPFNQIDVSVDRLAGFDSIFLYAGSSGLGGVGIFTDLSGSTYQRIAPALGQLFFNGDVDWTVANRLQIAANLITSSTPGSSVSLAAPYLLLTDSGGFTAAPGTSTFSASAQTIDIEGAVFSGFGQVNLLSTGDIRLSTPKVADGLVVAGSAVPTDTSTFQGSLALAGNLLMRAQRIYPVSAGNFTIATTAPSGTVTFQAPPGSDTEIPLSAGGSITVTAATIAQNGNLFAPLGQITLGGSGTQQVTLGPGSLTSVSLANTLVPFGETLDGTNWYYNASLNPLTQPPAKNLVLTSANVAVTAGSKVDVSGGGDLQAMEWIQGIGGSRDVLTATPTGQTVYALLPSRNDPVAAFDVHFTTARNATSAGDVYPLVGMQIHLDGGGGIPAGTYTLYPAHYATLPGALRVVYDEDNLGRNIASGIKLADGTVLVTGYYTQSTRPQTQSAGQALFAVQTGAVWQQYSEFSFTGANGYFAQKAAHDSVAVPELPMDAGRLAVAVQQSIILAGTALTRPAAGGRGGELDVSGNKLDVVSPDRLATLASDQPGFIGINVDELNGFGFASVLIGGLRSDTVSGTLIAPTADFVRVDTGSDALTAPEILLVAAPQAASIQQFLTIGATSVQVQFSGPATDKSGAVTVAPGSIIETRGTLPSAFARNYYFASPQPVTAAVIASELGGTLNGTQITNANLLNLPLYSVAGTRMNASVQQPAFSSLGAMLVATNDPNLVVSGPAGDDTPALTISFASVPTTTLNGTQIGGSVNGSIALPASTDAGRVSIGAGARITTGTLLLQATQQTGAITINPAAALQAKQVNLTARTIGIGVNANTTDSLLLSAANLAQLAGSEGLSLKAMTGGISFYGDVAFHPGPSMQHLVLDASTISGTGNASIDVGSGDDGGTITLLNTSGMVPAANPGVNATLTLNAKEIDLSGGAQTIAGFSRVVWSASNQVFVRGSGALTLGSTPDQVEFIVNTPNILVGHGTSQGGPSQFAVTTMGDLVINGPANSSGPAATDEFGGNLAITAAYIADHGTIEAQAGTLTLRATGPSGLQLFSNAYIAAGGYRKTLRDVERDVAGGKVVLEADAGEVDTALGSVINVSQPTGGMGYGGEIDVSALAGGASFNGVVLGGGGPGLGGTFNLDTKGAANLDVLAKKLCGQSCSPQLPGGGFTGAINIHTHTGSLILSAGNTLKANSITLTADDPTGSFATGLNGHVAIAGTIDASGYAGTTADGNGQAGGQVSLYGANAVTLSSTAVVDASTAHTDERGGDVTIGLGASAKGMIDLRPGSIIDVTGGSKGGLRGGTLTLRAPLQQDAKSGLVVLPIAEIGSSITGARSITLEAYLTFNTDGSIGLSGAPGSVGHDNGIEGAGWNGIIDPANNPFYTQTLKNFVEGNFIYTDANGNPWSYNFAQVLGHNSILNNDLTTLAQALGPNVLHLQPGIELVNPTGAITVASDWNLAAGTAYNLVNTTYFPLGAFPTTYKIFDFQQSNVQFMYRYDNPWGGIDPGTLSLRAAGNINVGSASQSAAISDGFFQFRDYLDSNYAQNVVDYLTRGNQIRGMDPAFQNPTSNDYLYYLNSLGMVPIAPYPIQQATPPSPATPNLANGASPTGANLAGSDLFPSTLRVCTANCGTSSATIVTVTNPSSWSYRFVAGANVSSANPTALPAGGAGQQDIVINGHSTFTVPAFANSFFGPTAQLVSVSAPSMVRTGTGNITIAASRDVVLSDSFAPGMIYAAGVNTAPLPSPRYSLPTGATAVTVGNPDGFLEPQVLIYSNDVAAQIYGPPTAAAFPQAGGDVDILAQRDVVGYQLPASGNKTTYQYYSPWLLSQSSLAPAADPTSATSLSIMGEGVFSPLGTNIASQSAWWVEYGSFQQGFLSAGGNIAIAAGRDLVDVSASLPTTGRVSGGLSPTSIPVTHVYDSGNMTVEAGRNILGGSFYEGSGHASIMARGSLGQIGTLTKAGESNPNQKPFFQPKPSIFLPNVPLFAVDDGHISVVAGGSITTAGVINPAAQHLQAGSLANPINLGGISSPDQTPIYMDTYGPNSNVSLLAVTGNLTITVAPTAINDFSAFDAAAPRGSPVYPASFEAIALSGDIRTIGLNLPTRTAAGSMPGLVLSASEYGTFDLLAQGSVDLTFGYPNGSTFDPRPYILAGPALLDTAFNPFRPNDGFDGAFGSELLAHQDDRLLGIDATARIYAVSGDIIGAGTTNPGANKVLGLTRVEINRPAQVSAGRDIVDLNLIVQNIQPSDVSSVEAGRNIYYTGINNAGGLQVAGPGFLVVQAGRDLGPFLPATHDSAGEVKLQQGIASVGNASMTPVGNIFIVPTSNGGPTGMYDPVLVGPFSDATKTRNAKLSTTGADIIALFGVAKGIEYQAAIDSYINSTDAAIVGQLTNFLNRIGRPATNPLTAFASLPKDLQDIFVDQVFFGQLKSVGDATNGSFQQNQVGYRMVNTLFPAADGYTANALTGGSTGANTIVATGDLNLLHGTIQTDQGGSISVLGPGGNILVGSLATEPNVNLKLRDLGILTLGGGAINTFTDANVLVNSSRVLTTQGGDILMWSSNGNLDAGRGSKTTLSLPPLEVLFDQDDYESVDLGGLVTGAGIGVLKTSSAATTSNLYLLAPHGTVNAGTAGLRISGNLSIIATVVLNASNITVGGTTTGVPTVTAPNIGALSAASNAAGTAAKTAELPAGSVGAQAPDSIFVVEVVGYGGGSGSEQAPSDEKEKSEQKQ
jgi:filamentous hemagglutinin family protein